MRQPLRSLSKDLEAAREAALRCVSRVRAIVGLQPCFLPIWAVGISESLAPANWQAIHKVEAWLGGDECVNWQGHEGENYHDLAFRLARGALIAYDSLPANPLALTPFVGLNYNSLAMRIRKESARAFSKWVEKQKGTPEGNENKAQPIRSLGDCRYAVGDREQTVEASEDDVLRAFFQLATNEATWVPLSTKELLETGNKKAPTILKNLRSKYNKLFTEQIDCPGKRGHGGFKVYVQN